MTDTTCPKCGGRGEYWTSEWEYERTVEVLVVCDACHPASRVPLIVSLAIVAAMFVAMILISEVW